jgi:hypothetical protein
MTRGKYEPLPKKVDEALYMADALKRGDGVKGKPQLHPHWSPSTGTPARMPIVPTTTSP